MRSNNKVLRKLSPLFASSALLLISVTPAFAGTDAPSWRPTYDLIMMWVNFLILFGVLYKVLKNPLSDFIAGKKFELEKEIQKAEDQKEKAEAKIQESKKMLEEGKARFEKVKERIIAQGEKKKQQIIEEAQIQSEFMMIEAGRKVDSQIVRAREAFKTELVDTAFDMVLDKLPQEITPEDDAKLIDKYIEALPN